MKIIGVTGSIGTGKSTVSDFFKKLGAYVIDLDEIVHELLRKNTYLCAQIKNHFGNSIVDEKGAMHRKKLGKKVFENKDKLNLLCGIIHPEVLKVLKQRLDEIGLKAYDACIVIDAPLLIEAHLLDLVDTVVVVKADEVLQIGRCKRKFGFSKEDVVKRMRAQMSLDEKMRFADFIIDNNSGKTNTFMQVKQIFNLINKPHR
ncbi:MAG: dephospho-CoA kinase [Candidatus Omnitrophota bacterium]